MEGLVARPRNARVALDGWPHAPRSLCPRASRACPLLPLALRFDSVSAPDFILPLGAGLAILTALLPIALKGGDEAARAMQERDAESFGKSMDSVAPKRKDE